MEAGKVRVIVPHLEKYKSDAPNLELHDDVVILVFMIER